jgi:transposase
MELIMTAPLSQDLRERIVRAVEDGSTIRQAARRFAVSASAAIKLMQRVRQTGSTAPAKIGGYRRPLLEKHADDLRAIVSRQAGITLKEMRDALHARGIVVKALSPLADMLHRLGLSHQKRACEPPSRIGPTWPGTAAAGGCGSVTWMRSASSLSTRPPQPQR